MQLNIISKLLGTRTAKLIQHGREIDAAIASHDQRVLARSSEAIVSYFDIPSEEFSRQNAFPAVMTLFLFLLSFTLNLLFLLDLFAVNSPPVHVALFFIPGIAFILYIYSASYLLSRGYNIGLLLYGYIFIALLVLGLFQLLYSLVIEMSATPFSFATLTTSMILFLSVFLSRTLMNSRSFTLFVLSCRTQRMAIRSRKLGMNTRSR